MVVVLMGVSGSGKTAVGERLARRRGWPFVDADDLHSAENIRKMKAGVALTDEDRRPWLLSVRDVMAAHTRSGTPAVIARSALKRRYRELMMKGHPDTRIVLLRVSPEVLKRRLRQRRGHFFDPDLLASQLEALEEPMEALVVDADGELDAVVEAVETGLGLPRS